MNGSLEDVQLSPVLSFTPGCYLDRTHKRSVSRKKIEFFRETKAGVNNNKRIIERNPGAVFNTNRMDFWRRAEKKKEGEREALSSPNLRGAWQTRQPRLPTRINPVEFWTAHAHGEIGTYCFFKAQHLFRMRTHGCQLAQSNFPGLLPSVFD